MKRPSFLFLAPFLTLLGHKGGFDAHGIAKQSGIVTLSHGIGTLKGIVTGYLVIRFFPQEMYGTYRFALSMVGIIGFIALPGMVSVLATQISQKKLEAPVRSAINIFSYWCLAGAVIVFASIGFLPLWNKLEIWPLIAVSALLFVPSNVGVIIFGSLTRGTGQFSRALSATLLSNVLQVICVLLILVFYPSALLLLISSVGIPAIVYSFHALRWSKEYPSRASFAPHLRSVLNLSIASVPTTLAWYADGLVVSAFFGVKQLAILSVALLLPEQIKIWTKELFPILYAKQAGGDDSWERRMKLVRLAGVGTILFGVGILAYCLLIPFLVPYLFPQYDASLITMLTIVAAIILITAPATVFPQYLEARGMFRELQYVGWISAIVYVALLFILVPNYGPLGAIIGRGSFRACNISLSLIMLLRAPIQPKICVA